MFKMVTLLTAVVNIEYWANTSPGYVLSGVSERGSSFHAEASHFEDAAGISWLGGGRFQSELIQAACHVHLVQIRSAETARSDVLCRREANCLQLFTCFGIESNNLSAPEASDPNFVVQIDADSIR